MENKRSKSESKRLKAQGGLKDGDADWTTQCEVCEQTPTVHPTGLCGPCCFGEADTVGGNW